mgnify:CR=1 FL=1
MTRHTFGEIVSILEAAYRIILTPEEHRVWFALLHPLGDDAARWAVVDLCRTSRFRPVPADLWQRAQEYDPPRSRLPMLDEPQPSEESRVRGLALVRAVLRAWENRR